MMLVEYFTLRLVCGDECGMHRVNYYLSLVRRSKARSYFSLIVSHCHCKAVHKLQSGRFGPWCTVVFDRVLRRDGLWGKFRMDAPERQMRTVERNKIGKRPRVSWSGFTW